jgi:hypothetical protein
MAVGNQAKPDGRSLADGGRQEDPLELCDGRCSTTVDHRSGARPNSHWQIQPKMARVPCNSSRLRGATRKPITPYIVTPPELGTDYCIGCMTPTSGARRLSTAVWNLPIVHESRAGLGES